MLITLNASRPIHLAGPGAELLDHLVGQVESGGLLSGAPDLARGFNDEAQLGFLLLDRQRIAVDGR